MATSFVIVGGGLAGAKAVEALRDNGFDGQLVLVADEEQLPYERPPLSKEFLAGKKSLTDFTVHDSAWYREHDVDLRLGVRAAAIDPAAHSVQLADDTTVGYDKLLLATGSRPRHLPIPGSDAAGVHYLRKYEDAVALDSALAEGSSLAVLGAGWIGLEVAAGARQRGVDVTVIETAKMPLLAALGEEVAAVFARLHREHGVDLRLQSQCEAITTADGKASGLKLQDGSTITADAVLVAVGAQPNLELAEQAGLSTGDGGVLVDASLCSSNSDIYAVGDIAAAEHPLYGTRIRTEHWANALKQPAVAAAGMLGTPGQYAELPYFFTDQYDLGMEYVGHAPRYDRVVFRGDVDSREFVAFWLDDKNRVLAGMNVNIWDVLDDVKTLIRSQRPVDPDRLGDPKTPLGELLS
ncbi:NAD(P)/FAD-dependent oxidoreductase [Mycobacterium shimoidei]|uniref:NAD(P)/FAD-dependent oxidoreductase n=1 Tax=Mycobacterium shimoidei TaxID=29313 RepID=UPI000848E06E|nr:FAD-dependent oxidoreductase [Mycobacterium shimoidei]MCV7259074.1 FAD-dependent oxidoreductase [Mycobacterium shimoidei]ODR13253.1 pyridine nucleotide-disulfide oxidoreductase [Mycobacterium shimoidei]ORW83290.1 pyridine nucleotide-disulfide oxidoreductase [Mycobacterium shimoidei]